MYNEIVVNKLICIFIWLAKLFSFYFIRIKEKKKRKYSLQHRYFMYSALYKKIGQRYRQVAPPRVENTNKKW